MQPLIITIWNLVMLNSSSCLKHYNYLLTQIDTCESTSAIHWTVRSWNETKTSTIESCFRDTDFPVNAWLSADTEDQDDDIPLNNSSNVYDRVTRLFHVMI